MKDDIRKWNHEVETLEAHKKPFLKFRNEMYSHLEQQLYELSNTKNRLIMERFLMDIKFWYEMQLKILNSKPKQD